MFDEAPKRASEHSGFPVLYFKIKSLIANKHGDATEIAKKNF